MKKSMLCIVIIITGWALSVHAATLGKVVKIQGNLILVKFNTQAVKQGDIVQISRDTGSGLVVVGTARVMRTAGDQAGAKILTRQPGVSVEPGDMITDRNDMAALSYDDELIDGRSAIEKLLLISNPIPIQESDPVFEDITALEKIWANLQGE